MGIYQKLFPKIFRDILRPLKAPIESLLKLFIKLKSQNQIVTGPFKGMPFSYPNLEYAMLLGTWELELSQIWEEVFTCSFSLMIDVGAAEGYYAVGMAKRNPNSRVVAFEMDEGVREKLSSLNDLNGSHVEIRGKCEIEDLLSFNQTLENAFILMDVEGYESVLLDPAKVPALKKTTILVEIHEMYVEGVAAQLKARFMKTHEIVEVQGIPRTVDHFPLNCCFIKKLFSPQRLLQFMDEGRPHEMIWYYMKPIESP